MKMEAVEDDGGQVGLLLLLQVGLLLPEAACHRARARNALVAPGQTPMSFINIHGTHCDTRPTVVNVGLTVPA